MPAIQPAAAAAQIPAPQPLADDRQGRLDYANIAGRAIVRTAVNVGWGVATGAATNYAIGRIVSSLPMPAVPAPTAPAAPVGGAVRRVAGGCGCARAAANAPAAMPVIPGGLPGAAPGIRDAAGAWRIPGFDAMPDLPFIPAAHNGPRIENPPVPMNNQEMAALNDRVVADLGGCTAAGMSIGMGIGSAVPGLGTAGGAILGAAAGAIVGMVAAHYHCESAARARR